MTERDIFMKLFDFSINTYYLWKKQGRLIFDLLDKYFSKEDLEEFITTGKVSRYEAAENNIYANHIRKTEILKFFSISDVQKLAIALAESLRKNGIESGSVKYLENIPGMQQFIDMLEHILVDRISELKQNTDDQTFKFVLEDFNEKVGFDFSKEDKPIISHILDRYKVYNTLYKLEKSISVE